VLIVDDTESKIARLVPVLVEAGVEREWIETCKNGVEARTKLRTKKYQLLILDIALPMREEERADPKGGISLLDEVDARANYIKPDHIVGLTAYADLHRDLEARFADQLWHLLHYDTGSSEWASRIGKLVSYLLDAKRGARQYNTDLCIMTALSDPELRAILDLPWSWSGADVLDASTFFHAGKVQQKTTEDISVVAASVNRPGMTPAAVLAAKMIFVFKPRFLILGGICAGVRGKCEIGDPILGSVAWDWQYGKNIVSNGQQKFLIEPGQLTIPSYVVAQFEQLKKEGSAFSEMQSAWRGGQPKHSIRVRIGPVASGSSVLADQGVLAKVAEQHRNLVGVDMETYGVYAATHYGPYPRPTAFALKGVSDFADDSKSDEWQAYASYTSARTIRIFVEERFGHIKDLAGTL
jgi:nucleoside phosphorylase